MVEVAPGRIGSADLPATGPTYRNIATKDSYAKLEGVATLYDLFERRYQRLIVPCDLHAELSQEIFTRSRAPCNSTFILMQTINSMDEMLHANIYFGCLNCHFLLLRPLDH